MPALTQALQDQNEDVRRYAVRALGRIGEDAVPALIQALQDQKMYVRRSAAQALERINKPQPETMEPETTDGEDFDF